jgi:hypothetical protein
MELSKEERLKKRQEIQSEGVTWNSPLEVFEDNFKRLIDTYTPEELLEELIECGLEITEEDKINLKEVD